ncbi:MAG TPA: hypothetical protein VFT31_17075 [Kribbella sp.]|nr:hypothetical protein [Kribbella sp.]
MQLLDQRDVMPPAQQRRVGDAGGFATLGSARAVMSSFRRLATTMAEIR